MKFYSDTAQKLYNTAGEPGGKEDSSEALPTEEAAPGESLGWAPRKRRVRPEAISGHEILAGKNKPVAKSYFAICAPKPRALDFGEREEEDIVVEEALAGANVPKDSTIITARREVCFQYSAASLVFRNATVVN